MASKRKKAPVVDLSQDDSDDSRDRVEVLRVAKATVKTDVAVVTKRSQQQQQRGRRGRRTFQCLICLEDSVEAYYGYTLDTCHHRFCKACLIGLIQSKSSEKQAKAIIPCPFPKCQKALTTSDIQYIFREEPYNWHKFSKQQNEAWIEGQVEQAGSDMCRCPAERCNYIFVHETAGRGKGRSAATTTAAGIHFDCPVCHHSFCLECPANHGQVGPAHVELTCEERRQELLEQERERQKLEEWKVENAQADDKFRELLDAEKKKGRTKPCPKCQVMVTKNGGCDHMSCRCGYQYYWKSGKKFP